MFVIIDAAGANVELLFELLELRELPVIGALAGWRVY